MYESRYATREDIDAAMRLGCGYPMGPLALMDLIGLDTAYEILDTMYKQGRDRLHAPSPIIKQMVTAGLRGRKTGRGFYTYAAPGSPQVVADALTPARSAAPGIVAADGVERRRRRFGDDGDRDRRGVREVRATRSPCVAAAPRRSTGVRAASRSRSSRGRGEGPDDGRGRRDAARAGDRAPRRRGDLADVDLVVEAVVEDLGASSRTCSAPSTEICRPGAILATTTSSLPVIDCAAVTSRPEDVVGMHFFNPAAVMKLVEVVHTVSTAPDVVGDGARSVRAASASIR